MIITMDLNRAILGSRKAKGELGVLTLIESYVGFFSGISCRLPVIGKRWWVFQNPEISVILNPIVSEMCVIQGLLLWILR